jgi:hypothetical protein
VVATFKASTKNGFDFTGMNEGRGLMVCDEASEAGMRERYPNDIVCRQACIENDGTGQFTLSMYVKRPDAAAIRTRGTPNGK